MIFGVVSFVVAAQSAQSSGIESAPAFELCKTLVGNWEGLVGKNVKVRFKFTLEQGGKMLVGNGLIDAGSKHPLPARAALGWDPEAKQVYYLDQHGTSTVYFGHVTREDNDLVFDFKALCGDSGHYRSRQHLSQDEYTSDMAEEQPDGSWKNGGLHITMHRVK